MLVTVQYKDYQTNITNVEVSFEKEEQLNKKINISSSQAILDEETQKVEKIINIIFGEYSNPQKVIEINFCIDEVQDFIEILQKITRQK